MDLVMTRDTVIFGARMVSPHERDDRAPIAVVETSGPYKRGGARRAKASEGSDPHRAPHHSLCSATPARRHQPQAVIGYSTSGEECGQVR
jgi:hypothetical protein